MNREQKYREIDELLLPEILRGPPEPSPCPPWKDLAVDCNLRFHPHKTTKSPIFVGPVSSPGAGVWPFHKNLCLSISCFRRFFETRYLYLYAV